MIRRLIFRLYRNPLPTITTLLGFLFFLIIYTLSGSKSIKFANLSTSIDLNELTSKLIPTQIFYKSTIKKNDQSLNVAIYDSIYEKVNDPNNANLIWRLSDSFQNFKVDNVNYIKRYYELRKNQHVYDPRISLSVYLHYLNDQFNEKSSNEIPFSWEDWVDLSYLNKFLNTNDKEGNGDKPISCFKFFKDFNIIIDFRIDDSLLSSDYYDKTFCLDNEEYLKTNHGKFKDEGLLPGFNFNQRIDEKSDFIAKIYNAKSYLLSNAPTPSFIYFLNDNGSYFKAKPYESHSMIRNGIFDKFITENNMNEFNPIKELNRVNANFLIHNDEDFTKQLANSNKFTIDIPEEKFSFDPTLQYKELFNKDVTELEDHERLFVDSMEYSINVDANDIDKHFKEVNIRWPASYKNHKLLENGGHYDARFFSGFLTEMPTSEFTFHSPEYLTDENSSENVVNKTNIRDNSINRRRIILSHLLHTVLTTAFHDGLLMFPAHGSLLSWYFTSLSFPWDTDGDVQMPISDLAEFCLRYNNSMIVENPKYGMSKVYVDCSSTLTHRGKENGSNNIDARVIDVDSGLFVDITGLSVSGDGLTLNNMKKIESWLPILMRKSYPYKPENAKKQNRQPRRKILEVKKLQMKDSKPEPIEINYEEEEKFFKIHKENKIYNCRNEHYYTYDQLSPMRLSLFEGAQTFVPANKKSLRSILETEYSTKSLKNPAFDNWVFNKNLRMWVSADDIYKSLFENQVDVFPKLNNSSKKKKRNVKGAQVFSHYNNYETLVISDLIRNGVYDLTLDQGLVKNKGSTIETPNLNTVEQLFHEKYYTSVHSREMAIFNSNWEWRLSASIDDHSSQSLDWRKLAQGMLQDHPPAQPALLDHLL